MLTNFTTDNNKVPMRISVLLLISISIGLSSCSKKELVLEESTSVELIPEITPIDTSAATNFTVAAEKTNTWVSNMQQANGLLESSENSDFVSLYDNSLAALVYI